MPLQPSSRAAINTAWWEKTITSLSVLNDGRLLSTSDDNSLVIWNSFFEKPDNIIYGEEKIPIRMAKALKNGSIVIGSFKELILYDQETLKFRCTIKEISSNVTYIMDASENSLILSGSYREVKVWQCVNEKQYKNVATLTHHSSVVKVICMLNENRFASAGLDHYVCIYSFKNFYLLKKIQFKYEIHSLCSFSINDVYDQNFCDFFVGNESGNIYQYNEEKKTFTIVYDYIENIHKGHVNSIQHIFQGFVSASDNGAVVIRDSNFKIVSMFNPNNRSITCVQQLSNGLIFVAGEDNIIYGYG